MTAGKRDIHGDDYRNNSWEFTLSHEKYMWLFGSTVKDCSVSPWGRGLRRHAELVEQWLPLFRRNCWLCGCPIEATAEEKTEWVQGFTEEEIEAWNLKM